MIARTCSGDFFRAAAMRATRLPYSSSTTLLMTSRVSGLMSERVNISPKSLYLPACSTSTLTPILSSVFLKYIISARRPFSMSGSLRSEIDAVGAEREIILARAGRAQVRVHRLAGLAKLLQIGADLFELRPSGGNPLRLQHDSPDVRIGGGLLQVLPDAGDGRAALVAAQKVGQFDRRLLRNVAVQPQHQHGVIGDLRRLFAKAEKGEEEQHEGEEDEHDARHQPDEELRHSYSDGSMRPDP